jgi:hypothetical protein
VLDHKTFSDANPSPKFKVNLEVYSQYENNKYEEKGWIFKTRPGESPSSQRQYISGKIRELVEVDPKVKLEADDLQALLSPGMIPGYSLLNKFWGYFHLYDPYLSSIEWKENPIHELQIEPKHKLLLGDLIAQHGIKKASMNDIVPGKGNGLIILLHGLPGCGKTLTAGKHKL